MQKGLPTVAVALVVALAIPGRLSVAGAPTTGRTGNVQQGAKTMLQSSKMMAFVATSDAKRARAYYEETLGMQLLRDEPFALVFDATAQCFGLPRCRR